MPTAELMGPRHCHVPCTYTSACAHRLQHAPLPLIVMSSPDSLYMWLCRWVSLVVLMSAFLTNVNQYGVQCSSRTAE